MVTAPMLIDTSMWTCAIRRKGFDVERARVMDVIVSGMAAWCDAVRLELWQGVSGEFERRYMTELEQEITLLPTTPAAWNLACRLADLGRRKGQQYPYADLLIYACARMNKVEILERDHHYSDLAKLHEQLKP